MSRTPKPATKRTLKRTMLLALLAVAALWPLAHYAIVERYGMDNWKFGGWAMYTTPQRTLLSVLLTKVPGGYKVLARESWPEYVHEAQRRFDVQRKALGELWPPDELAAAALAARPELDNVVVLVQVLELDPATERIASSKRRFEYGRRP